MGGKIEGLDPEHAYQIKFKYIDNQQIIKSQWAGNNNSGVLERVDAKRFDTSDDELILFRFSPGE